MSDGKVEEGGVQRPKKYSHPSFLILIFWVGFWFIQIFLQQYTTKN